MSKGKQEQPENGFSEEKKAELPNAEKSKAGMLSQEAGLYTPKKRERKQAYLCVEQYLRQSKHDAAISGLIRSMYRTKIATFAEWEREVTTLLKKKTW